jgi:hypothetical protein
MPVSLRPSIVLVALSVAAVACNPNSIGRPCVNPGKQRVEGVQVSSPALECPSRLCLIASTQTDSANAAGTADGGVRATCTARCQHDSDCDAETKAFCKSGFACAVAMSVGPFCCEKLCICRDDLTSTNSDPDGGTRLPETCLPGRNPECPNVPAR